MPLKVIFVVAINVVASYGWSLSQMDVNNAFLQGYLHKDVYMELPQRFHRHGEKKVCKLEKYMALNKHLDSGTSSLELLSCILVILKACMIILYLSKDKVLILLLS